MQDKLANNLHHDKMPRNIQVEGEYIKKTLGQFKRTLNESIENFKLESVMIAGPLKKMYYWIHIYPSWSSKIINSGKL